MRGGLQCVPGFSRSLHISFQRKWNYEWIEIQQSKLIQYYFFIDFLSHSNSRPWSCNFPTNKIFKFPVQYGDRTYSHQIMRSDFHLPFSKPVCCFSKSISSMIGTRVTDKPLHRCTYHTVSCWKTCWSNSPVKLFSCFINIGLSSLSNTYAFVTFTLSTKDSFSSSISYFSVANGDNSRLLSRVLMGAWRLSG